MWSIIEKENGIDGMVPHVQIQKERFPMFNSAMYKFSAS